MVDIRFVSTIDEKIIVNTVEGPEYASTADGGQHARTARDQESVNINNEGRDAKFVVVHRCASTR